MNNFFRFIAAAALLTAAIFMLGNINNDIDTAYQTDNISISVNHDEYDIHSDTDAFFDTVVGADYEINDDMYPTSLYYLLIDETDHKVLAADNVHERMYPASMTKLMTAIIVAERIESGVISKDDIVTLSHNYYIAVDGAGTSELTTGCKISVDNLMHGLLIESNNFYSLILAEYVAGDVESFCELMNEKAYSIGATNSHFMNPHGLDDPDHYTTAYDIYLITKEAAKSSYIREISQYESYPYCYTDPYGFRIDKETVSTNLFLHDKAVLPTGFNILAYKTGTTTGAGNCLSLYLTKDDKEYYLVMSDNDSRKKLYKNIAKLLCYVE